MPTYVFGDSHADCFTDTFVKQVYSYRASSAKGLNNPESSSGVNKEITEIITTTLPEDANIIFFFGKVDLDFIINYKYNTSSKIDFNAYVKSIVNAYIEFVKSVVSIKNTYICELPVTHIDDKHMLEILRMENHSKFINSQLDKDERCIYFRYFRVLPYDMRIHLYNLFNKELQNACKLHQFRFIQINKYFINADGKLKIPVKYINTEDPHEHHLLPNICELYIRSIIESSC